MSDEPPEPRRRGWVGLLSSGSFSLVGLVSLAVAAIDGADVDPLTVVLALAVLLPSVALAVGAVALALAWVGGSIVHIRELNEVKAELQAQREVNRLLLKVNEVAVPAAIEKAGPPR